MMLADLGQGELLWALLGFFFVVMYFVVLVWIVIDLFRDRELSGVSQALWVIFLLLLPVLSVVVYLVTRGDGMGQRSAAHILSAQATDPESAPTDQVHRAKSLLDSGAISDEEYAALKQKALS
jgi:hypothetical protein